MAKKKTGKRRTPNPMDLNTGESERCRQIDEFPDEVWFDASQFTEKLAAAISAGVDRHRREFDGETVTCLALDIRVEV